MANVNIRGQTVNIDIEAELNEFEWERARWSSSKLIAASPFRFDKSPSFFVNLDGELAGMWGDSGYYDDEWKSGNIVKLLSYMRNETYEETTEYLLERYDISSDNRDLRLILPNIPITLYRKALPRGIIVAGQSPYLTKRGIYPDVQAQAGVGKSQHKRFVAIPWNAPDGKLANVKYRATRGKTFFYEKGATPIRSLVYGADLYVKSSDDLIVCEAEIDALSWRSAGFNAVAVGGVAFTNEQSSIISRLPAKRLLLAGDNDKAGQRFNARVASGVKSKDIALIQLAYSDCKDANDVLCRYGVEALREAVTDALDIPKYNVKVDV